MCRRVTVLVLCDCVCLFVCLLTLAVTSFVLTLKVKGAFLLICGFSIKPSVQKLWREKANMLAYRNLAPMALMQRHFARIFEDRSITWNSKTVSY